MEAKNYSINRIPGRGALFGAGFFAALIFGVHGALLFGSQASAATPLGFPNNLIPNGHVITAAGSPYHMTGDTLKVPAWATVTIEPGVVIKMRTGMQAQFLVDGMLIANGTADNPVVITSDKDDDYGGDINGDGDASAPAPGDWSRISVNRGGRIVLEHARIRYGGFSSIGGALELYPGSSATSTMSTFEYSVSNAIYMTGTLVNPAFLHVSGSTFQYTSNRGLDLSGALHVVVSGSIFTNNSRGMRVHSIVSVDDFSISGNSFYNNSVVGFEFIGAGPFNALNNWWGSPSGPTIASNPGGSGDAIVGNVLYDPWTGADPSNSAPALSFVDDEGYSDSGVSPSISFIGQDVPVFKVLYDDEDGDAAQYVRLVVGDDAFVMATSSDGVFVFDGADGGFGKGGHSYHFEASDGVDLARLPASGELSFEVRNVPVILVPGIMGTELWRGGDLIWPNIGQMVFWFLDDFMDPLAMNIDGNSGDDSVAIGDIVREPIDFAYDIFNALIDDFEDGSYSEDRDLFVFPYDWRLDIGDSSQKLDEKINSIIAQTGSQKVDIIVHSMGGLVAKQYVLDNSASKVNKLVFVGTPHLGSPKSTKMLLFGDDLVRLFLSFLNPLKMKYLSRNMLSVYQLLPSQEYVDQIGKYFYDLTIPKSFTHTEVNNYLTVQGLNWPHLQNAMSFHSDAMDNFDATGIEAYNIVGCDTATLGKIIIRNQGLIETEFGVEFVAGDGTVPFGSASAIDTPADKTFYATGIEHATMPSQSSIRQLITQIITNDIDISSLEDITQDINQCVFNGQVVSVHSPVNLHIYDENGNHVGPDENGDIDLNIIGATYEQIGDNKFIFIPNTDSVSYDIQLDGTGEGTFSLRVSKLENNEITETAYYSDIPVNESSQAQITLSTNVSNTVLEMDEAGSGSFQAVSVASVLDSEQSQDTTKPSTAISFSGGQSGTTYTNSVQISLSATDDNAGILKTEYSLDGGITWNTYANSFTISTIGETTITYRSTDRAGNTETAQSQAIRVMPASVILLSSPALSSDNDNTATNDPQRHSELDSGSDPEVLGEKIERPQAERYTAEEILDALADADIETLMDYLGRKRDTALEQAISERYGKGLSLSQGTMTFITYGTKSTQALGAGERAGVLHSFQEAFGRLPESATDWDDVVKISINQPPSQRSAQAEQKAKDTGANNEQSVMMIAYGLRPMIRSLELEQEGISRFVEAYGRLPSSTLDWNILRSIVY